jgi:protein-disulfide isomerase
MPRARLAALAAALLLGTGGGLPALAQEGPPQPAPLARPDVERIVREYLLQNPEVVYEAIQELQRRREAEEAGRQQAALAQHRSAVFEAPGDPVAGDPRGDVTLVEFFDYRCGYCRNMVPGLRALLAADPKLRFVFKELPILSPESTMAAKAALAADRQGKYAELHFALMQAKDLSREAILAAAAGVGLDPARLERDMEAPEIAAKLEENMRLAQALGITGTPAFVAGDQIIPGAVDPAQLAALVAQQRAAVAN